MVTASGAGPVLNKQHHYTQHLVGVLKAQDLTPSLLMNANEVNICKTLSNPELDLAAGEQLALVEAIKRHATAVAAGHELEDPNGSFRAVRAGVGLASSSARQARGRGGRCGAPGPGRWPQGAGGPAGRPSREAQQRERQRLDVWMVVKAVEAAL